MEPTGRPVVAVGAVVVHDGHLLLVERGRPPSMGRWAVPGGRVEFGERIVDAVEREVLEETGVTVRCGTASIWVERIDEQHHVLIVDLVAELVGSPVLTPGDDASDARWVALDELDTLPLVDGLLDAIAPLLDSA